MQIFSIICLPNFVLADLQLHLMERPEEDGMQVNRPESVPSTPMNTAPLLS